MKKHDSYAVVGHFDSAHAMSRAITALRSSPAAKDIEYFSPFPDHRLEHALYAGRRPSPVRFFVFFGGLIGCLSAFVFTSWMSIDYPLRVSAKPLVSFPAFVVIAFECTVLLAAGMAFLSLLFFSKVSNLRYRPEYRPQFSEGTFGLVVRVPQQDTTVISDALAEHGVREVEVIYVR